MPKAIIFDWGGVLVDAETKEQYPEAFAVLQFCKAKGYRLALACIASKFKERKKQIESSGLMQFFEKIQLEPMPAEKIWDSSYRGKDAVFDRIMEYFNLPAKDVLIIDDRTVRGVRYANAHGHPSIWVRRGKFANEEPNRETGEPTCIAVSLSEVRLLLEKLA